MIIRFFIPFLMVFWLLSCADNYGGSGPNNNTGFTPPGQQPPPSGGSCKGEWGGVTCTSSGDRDQSFLDFISNGTLIDNNSVGNISCTPSNSGGIIFKLRVTLNAPLKIGSDNNLTMQPASSALEMQIVDSRVGDQVTGGQLEAIGFTLQGVSGTINGNRADLQFSYNGNNGWKKVRMEGTLEGSLFKGRIHFENEKYCNFNPSNKGQCSHTTPGRSGVLGNFTSPICSSTFTSN